MPLQNHDHKATRAASTSSTWKFQTLSEGLNLLLRKLDCSLHSTYIFCWFMYSSFFCSLTVFEITFNQNMEEHYWKYVVKLKILRLYKTKSFVVVYLLIQLEFLQQPSWAAKFYCKIYWNYIYENGIIHDNGVSIFRTSHVVKNYLPCWSVNGKVLSFSAFWHCRYHIFRDMNWHLSYLVPNK